MRSQFSCSASTASFSATAFSYASVISATVASAFCSFSSASSFDRIASSSCVAAAIAACRLGSTSSLMSQYLVMLMTKSHSPAAAFDLLRIVSTWKCSLLSSGRMFLKLTFGIFPSSIFCLKPSSSLRNAVTSFIITVDAFHDASILPFEPSCSR